MRPFSRATYPGRRRESRYCSSRLAEALKSHRRRSFQTRLSASSTGLRLPAGKGRKSRISRCRAGVIPPYACPSSKPFAVTSSPRRLNRSVRHKATLWKPTPWESRTSVCLRLGEDLVDRKILRRIRKEWLVGSASQQSVQLAGIRFAGDEDVLPGRNAVLLIVVDQVIPVKGKAIFDVAPYLVYGDAFVRPLNLADDGSQRAGRVGRVQQLDVLLGSRDCRQAKERTDPEDKQQHDDQRDHGGDTQPCDPKAGDDDQDQQCGSQTAGNRRQQDNEWWPRPWVGDMPRQQQPKDDGDRGEQSMQQQQPKIQALLVNAVDVIPGEDGERRDRGQDVTRQLGV